MSYRRVSIHQTEKELIAGVIRAGDSLLLIPPGYQDKQPLIGEAPGAGKYIGLFSSGSTGTPKAIWNTYQNLQRNAEYTAEAFAIKPEDRLLILARPWHVAGLSWALMAEQLGCTYRFVTTKRGEGSKWLKAVHDFHPDVVLTVPKVLSALYGHEWKANKIVFGGLPLPEEDTLSLSRHASILIQGYGMTEAGGLISCHVHEAEKEWFRDEHRCCGRPVHGVELRCPGTKENPAEIFIRSSTAAYDDWYRSGDLGYFDKEGRIYLTGRISELRNNDKI